MKTGILIVIPFFLAFTGVSLADCWVEDGTYYSKNKTDLIPYAIAMDEGNKEKAIQIVDEKEISSSNKAACTVLAREGSIVKVDVLDLGKVWVYRTSVHCN